MTRKSENIEANVKTSLKIEAHPDFENVDNSDSHSFLGEKVCFNALQFRENHQIDKFYLFKTFSELKGICDKNTLGMYDTQK